MKKNFTDERIKAFYLGLKKLGAGFGMASREVAARRKEFARILNYFIAGSSVALNGLASSGNQGTAEIVAGNAAAFSRIIEKWAADLENFMKVTDFVKEHEDRFLVMVFGKVDAGKSALGNVVAGREFKRAGIAVTGCPEYFIYDGANYIRRADELAELEKDGFEVKETESTSSIQGFVLEGLTWVDTPGIHSLTEKNEELAKKYVDGADIVLYVMSSDSPAKASDMAEIEKLLEREKNFMVVITKSDTTEEDEENGRIVSRIIPKSGQDRRDQSEYCANELSKLDFGNKLKNRDVIHVSVPVLSGALANGDPGMLEKSGFPELLTALRSVLESEGVAIKRSSPANRLNGFINTILTKKGEFSVFGIKAAFEANLDEIDRRINGLGEVAARIRESLEYEMLPSIREYVYECADSGVPVSSMQAGLEERLEQITSTVISRELSKDIRAFNEEMAGNFSVNMGTLAVAIEDRYAEYTYTVTSGKSFYECAGGLAGALVGFLVGGPLGAVIGGFIGSGAGNALAGEQDEVRSSSVKVGDNRDEAVRAVERLALEAAGRAVNEKIQEVKLRYFVPVKIAVKKILMGIESCSSELEKLKL